MQLKAPTQAIDIETQDIFGNAFSLNQLRGQRVMLCFFRDAACPFCNLRLYELTQKYEQWKSSGLIVVAVFSSPANEVRDFVARRPRPFIMLSDPNLQIYDRYGIEHSAKAMLKALFFKLPRVLGGIAKGGRPRANPHADLIPADFLVNEKGRIVETWYGENTSDHMPLAQVQAFANKGSTESLGNNKNQQSSTELKLKEALLRAAKLEATVKQLNTRIKELEQKNNT